MAVYSAILIGFELATSQDEVRPFFSDIPTKDIRFFAVNTTLSASLLWATGLCFVFALSFSDASTDRKSLLFFASQIAVFGYMGVDDRFQAHEWIAYQLGTQDYYILLAVGVFNLFALWFWGRRYLFQLKVFIPLAIAAPLFAIMILFDAAMPQDMVLRLTIEDLCKSWAALAFLVFGWAVLQIHCKEQFAK